MTQFREGLTYVKRNWMFGSATAAAPELSTKLLLTANAAIGNTSGTIYLVVPTRLPGQHIPHRRRAKSDFLR